jgi:hypothetical protein
MPFGAADGVLDGAADGSVLGTDHSTPRGVADGQANSHCSETQTAQRTARWMLPPMDQRSAQLTAASNEKTLRRT